MLNMLSVRHSLAGLVYTNDEFIFYWFHAWRLSVFHVNLLAVFAWSVFLQCNYEDCFPDMLCETLKKN